MSTTIREYTLKIRERIREISEETKCDPAKINVIAVSKYQSVQKISEAYECGIRDFGENRVQEFMKKFPALPRDIQWHFLGHLQTNKIKYILPFVYIIHSVDSRKLLQALQTECKKSDLAVSCLIQIKISEESTKYGVTPSHLEDCLRFSRSQDRIRIKGLMGIASFTQNKEQIRREFSGLKYLYDRHKSEYSFSILSMGMTADYPLAIGLGATHVRIGTGIFGERKIQDH